MLGGRLCGSLGRCGDGPGDEEDSWRDPWLECVPPWLACPWLAWLMKLDGNWAEREGAGGRRIEEVERWGVRNIHIRGIVESEHPQTIIQESAVPCTQLLFNDPP